MRELTVRSLTSTAPAARPSSKAPQAAPAPAAKPSLGGDSLTLGARPYNSLQRHGAYFDADNDHKVTLKETTKGLQDMGLSAGNAKIVALITNAGQALPQKHLTTIDLDAVNAHIDPTTPGAFDAQGNFDTAKFEKMFSYDGGKTGSLTEAEVGRLIDDSALTKFGKFRTKAGYNLLFKVAADTQKPVLDASGTPVMGKDGKPQVAPSLSRERLKSFFTGTVFYDVAAAHGNVRPVRDGL
jgi:hypothetical protein